MEYVAVSFDADVCGAVYGGMINKIFKIRSTKFATLKDTAAVVLLIYLYTKYLINCNVKVYYFQFTLHVNNL